MMKRVSHRRAALLALLPLAAAIAFVVAGTSSAARKDPTGPPVQPPHQQPLHGHMRNIVQHFGCPQAPVTGVCSTFEADGSINGDGFVVVDTPPVSPADDPAKVGFSEAHTVIHTAKGDLACHEAALFDLETGLNPHAFVDLCLIQGNKSTGDYAGATGYIRESGAFDFVAGVGELEYTGLLVTPAH
jgi:hypothetical protein